MKSNNKGFTLVELLGVLIILIVIFLMAIPIITKLVKDTNSDIDEATKEIVLDATKDYLTAKSDIYVANANNKYCILINDLVDNSFLTETQISLLDEIYTSVEVSFDDKLDPKMVIKSDDCHENITSARLTLKGKKTVTLKLRADGSIRDYVESGLYFYNGEDEEPTILNFELNNNLIDGLVIKVYPEDGQPILCTSSNNCLPQTSKNVFKVKYQYYPENGKKYVAERTVKVIDDEAPVITLESEEDEISLTTTEYDVRAGVSVTDNSGEILDIKATSNLTFGQLGTYVITYTATDSSGNVGKAVKKVIIR